MNRQELLQNFVTATRGKGQAKIGSACCYFPKDHPGCAIGCQPGFRDKFESIMEDSEKIVDRLHGDVCSGEDKDISDQLRLFFDIDSDSDVAFLDSLQSLHDDTEWVDGCVSQNLIDDFCKEFDLAKVTA